MDDSQYQTIIRGEGDEIFYNALRLEYTDYPDVLLLLDSMENGNVPKNNHKEYLRKRGRGRKNIPAGY